jgi:thiol-disulfide isomerase/thioredoxin
VRVSVFGKRECDACRAAVEKIEYFARKWKRGDVAIEYIDMDTPDGLAEGAYRDVYDIPTVILEREGDEVVRWVKTVPISQEFRKYFLQESMDE